ncbi:MAG TPA: tRNA (N6-isopentenyl adenosine(37)-C2)-methylthiotransferase MiaB [Peptococcaceae bacterium]|nr:tRNA (N6-isopentenyl adenosine(37)-C2)-methylthiotransferase MiaB [Peptococcaceae bacterium]
MNDYDSELMAGLLEETGYEKVDRPEKADVIVVNTCCVRETAERKVWGLLGTLKRLKRRKPDLVIAVTGCLPQQNGAAEDIRRRFPHVDLVIGTHNRHELPRLVEEVRAAREPLCAVWREAGEVIEGLPVRRESKLSAWVPIMFGCDNFCTYCVVPYVRGRERSRRPEDIIREVETLVAQGYREVTLLGQNVNSYGRGLDPPTDFATLLERLDRVEGLWRIRYTTSHPRDFTQRLIDVIANSEKVCEHFHLPVQAGSNRILRRMHRGYTREDYLRLVDGIRAAVPEASITTDIMVGFPGETEEDFQDTLELVRQVQFDQAFTFVYNPRKGTPAARMPDQVPAEVKSRRIQELIAVQKEISLAKNRAEQGKVHEILVEGPSETDAARLAGRTRTNKTVVFEGAPAYIGTLVPVEIIEGKLTHLVGVVRNLR